MLYEKWCHWFDGPIPLSKTLNPKIAPETESLVSKSEDAVTVFY